jgi:hypothetical protein
MSLLKLLGVPGEQRLLYAIFVVSRYPAEKAALAAPRMNRVIGGLIYPRVCHHHLGAITI